VPIAWGACAVWMISFIMFLPVFNDLKNFGIYAAFFASCLNALSFRPTGEILRA
jgi:hypothetical protein